MYQVVDMGHSIYDAFYDKFLFHVEISTSVKKPIFTIFNFGVGLKNIYGSSTSFIIATKVKTSSRRIILQGLVWRCGFYLTTERGADRGCREDSFFILY